jgi:hypothetical protein
MTDEMNERNVQRMQAGAKNYALADKSDPFAYNRAMSHIAFGLCTPCEPSDMIWYDTPLGQKQRAVKIGPEAGAASHYNATPTIESKWGHPVTVYHNVVRL